MIFKIFIILNIITNVKSDDCNLKFENEMEKNLGIQNLTLQKLKEYIFISDYYFDCCNFFS